MNVGSMVSLIGLGVNISTYDYTVVMMSNKRKIIRKMKGNFGGKKFHYCMKMRFEKIMWGYIRGLINEGM